LRPWLNAILLPAEGSCQDKTLCWGTPLALSTACRDPHPYQRRILVMHQSVIIGARAYCDTRMTLATMSGRTFVSREPAAIACWHGGSIPDHVRSCILPLLLGLDLNLVSTLWYTTQYTVRLQAARVRFYHLVVEVPLFPHPSILKSFLSHISICLQEIRNPPTEFKIYPVAGSTDGFSLSNVVVGRGFVLLVVLAAHHISGRPAVSE